MTENGIEFISPTPKDDQRPASQFEEIPGGKIALRRDHHNTPSSVWEGQKGAAKGIEASQRQNDFIKKQEIVDGIELYEQESAIPSYDTWNDWDIASEERNLLDYRNKEQSYQHAKDSFRPLAALWTVRHEAHAGNARHRNYRRVVKDDIEQARIETTGQSMGIATLVQHLRSLVEESPDITTQSLLFQMRLLGQSFRLTNEQKELFENGIYEYWKKHTAVKQAVQSYSDPAVLYEKCFGVKPSGKVEMIQGPMTILFRCFEEDDYVQAHQYGVDKNDNVDENQKREHVLLSGGVAKHASGLPALKECLVVENATGNDPEYTNAVRIHEEQHQFNRLFTPVEYQREVYDIFDHALRFTQEPVVVQKKIAHEWMRLQRRALGIDSQARNEIIAYLADGTKPEEIVTMLQFDPLYDYINVFKVDTDVLAKQLEEAFSKYIKYFDPNNYDPDDAIQSEKEFMDYMWTIQGMTTFTQTDVDPFLNTVFRDEYRKDVQKWLDAVGVMQAKGYTKSMLEALLYSQPVGKWGVLAKRLPFAHEFVTLRDQLPKDVLEKLDAFR